MSTSWTPFTCEQLVAIGQDLSQAIRDDPTLIALFLGRAPSSTPGPATTPGPLTTPRTNPSHHCRNPRTTLASTCCPQQAINSIPSVNKLCITATLAILDTITSHVIGHAGMGLHQMHDFSHAKVAMSSHVGPSALCAITIQGSPHEVGDALIAVGCQIVKCRIRPPRQRVNCPTPSVQGGPSDPPNPTPCLPPSPPSHGMTHATPRAPATTPTPSSSSIPRTAPHTSIASTPTPTPMQMTSVPTVLPSVSSMPAGLMPIEIDVLRYPQATPAP